MKKYTLGVVALASVLTLATAVPALADTNTSNASTTRGRPFGLGHAQGAGMMKPVILGKVSGVSGDTITVAGQSGFGRASTTTTFSVDATNAKIIKNNVAGTISSIAVGDNVIVQGTVTGGNVVATLIRDVVMAGNPGQALGKGIVRTKMASSTTPNFVGNGEPVVAGTISAINGSAISITNKSNIVYNIDASGSKFLEGNNTIGISTLKIGDAVVVQGTINGTSIVATTIIDQTGPANNGTRPANSGNAGNGGNPHPGIFGGIGQFFIHLFGF